MCDCPWTARSLGELLSFAEKHGDPANLWMSRPDFADIRKFGRDMLDLNSMWASLKDGHVGTVYGKGIWIFGARPGWISVRDSDGKVLVHALKGGNREDSTVSHAHHLGHPHFCPDPDCIVRFVMTG